MQLVQFVKGDDVLLLFRGTFIPGIKRRIRITGQSSDPRIDATVKKILIGLECDVYINGEEISKYCGDDSILHEYFKKDSVVTYVKDVFEILCEANRHDLAMSLWRSLDESAPMETAMYIFEGGTYVLL